MSILDTNNVDIIAVRPDTNAVRLVVADHLDWQDTAGHCRLVQEKLNTYIAFVESGQLASVKEPAIPEAPDVTIVLALQHAPSDEAETFLGNAKQFLADIGLGLEVEIRGTGQHSSDDPRRAPELPD